MRLSREYAEAIGNEPAGNGWLARAEGLLRDVEPGPAHGWLELTWGSRAFDADRMRAHAEAALGIARRSGEAELEASALALLGRSLLLGGEFDAGVTALDESTVVTTAGEVSDPVVFGDSCCVVTLACEESGELLATDALERRDRDVHVASSPRAVDLLLRQCGAEFFPAKDDLGTAERCLVEALGALEGTGHRSRCIHPAAQLTELRILQGRVEGAEHLLAGREDLPESLGASDVGPGTRPRSSRTPRSSSSARRRS